VLDGVYAKLDRARVHATELKALVEESLRNAGGFESRPGDRPGELVFVATGVPRIDPAWSTVLGDVLTNLRAALDHLAWQLVVLSDGEPTKQTSFPIRTPGPDGQAPRALTLRGARPDMLAELEEIQPAGPHPLDGQPTENNGLFILNELVNIDKHRLLLLIAAQLSLRGAWWPVIGDDPGPSLQVADGPLRTGSVAARFDFLDSTPPEGFDPHLEYTVVLADAPGIPAVRTVSLTQLLSRLYFDVEHGVVGRMAHHFNLDHRVIMSVYTNP